MIRNTQFVADALKVVNTKTVYMWGTFGDKEVSEALIRRKKAQYPSYYTNNKTNALRQLIGKNVVAWDCVGLIKGLLWRDENGVIRYASNGVPDTNANGFINLCYDVSSNFTNLVVGEVVWLTGHIGIYAGYINGVRSVIEATPSWKNGVQITALTARAWKRHGKIPYVQYASKPTASVGVSDSTSKNILDVDGDWGRATTTELQIAMKSEVDGIVSEPYSNLIAKMQMALGVPITGKRDVVTIRALQKYVGTTVDGIISTPKSSMVAKMQDMLNKGTFRLIDKLEKPTPKPEPVPIPVAPKPTPKPVEVPEKRKVAVTKGLNEETILAWQIAWDMPVKDGKISEPNSDLIKKLQEKINDGTL